jgi:regulator of sirC expression with transglutaminase-like and TPR domain
MNNNEVNALIQLLDDPDEHIFHQVRSKIISLGQEVIPHLESYWETGDYGLIFQERVENIIHEIQFSGVRTNLLNWAKEGGEDLMSGAIILANYQYPDLNLEAINKELDTIVKDVWMELNENLTSFEKVKVINHVLFNIHEFTGNKTNFHAPQNCFINDVIQSKKGNPLSLCIIYIHIAKSLNIPIYGINLPSHFVLGYLDEYAILDNGKGKDQVLFYINAFSRGAIFYRQEIDSFLNQMNIEPKEYFYTPCSNADIILRQMKNLIYSYNKLGYKEKENEIIELYKTLLPFSKILG